MDKPVESLCAHCADLAFPCTRFWMAYPARRLSNSRVLAIIQAISKSAAEDRRDAAKTLTGFASASRQRGRDGRCARDASPAKTDRSARTWREGFARISQTVPSGRREALGSARRCAGRNGPPLHRGRRFRADRSPLSKDGDGRRRRTDPRGCVRARGRDRCERPLRGGRRSEDRQGARSALDGAERQVPGKGRLCEKPRRTGQRTAFPRRDAGRGGRMAARSPWGSGPSGGRNVRRLLRIGSQAGSRGVRRCLAGHAPCPPQGTGQPDASILYGAANRRSTPFSQPFPSF